MSSTQNEHSCGSYAVLGCDTEDRHLGSSQWKASQRAGLKVAEKLSFAFPELEM